MERILTQEEIAELLSAVRDGDVEAEVQTGKVDTSASKVTRFDLLKAHAKGQIRVNNLDLIIDSFARNFSISLTNRVQQPVSIVRQSIETYECDDFLLKLGPGAAIGIFRFDPMQAGSLLVFDDSLAFALVETLLGGNATGRRLNPRTLTAIELNILRNPFADATLDMVKTFGDLEGVKVTLMEVQNNPRLVNAIPHESMTVVADLQVSFANYQGRMQMVLPTGILDPLRDTLQTRRNTLGPKDGWQKSLRKGLESVPVEVSAELGQITLEMRDFINFQVGDIIDLPWAPSDLLNVYVEGHPKYRGQAGVRNGNKAVRVTGTFQEDSHVN